MCWFIGPTTESVFVTVNEQCSAQHLAKLVLGGRLAISSVDPACRTEVERLVVDRMMDEPETIAKEHQQIVDAMWVVPPEEGQKRYKG